MKMHRAEMCIAVFLAVCAGASATVLHVPGEYATIQAGINAAADGDTVLVADGTYTGSGNRDIDFWGKAIVVMSENGPEATVIDCEGSASEHHRGFSFSSGEIPSAVVQGFTIRNGYAARGGGIYSTNDSRPTIIGNIITGNEASEHGGGIYCDGFWAPVIAGNTIFANAAACGGGGIACHEWSDNAVEGNTIAANVAGQFGGGISCETSTAILVDNTIKGNTSLIRGGGISISGWSAPTITNNTIAGNTASVDGGGIHFTGWCFTTIKRNSIDGNSAGQYGGGIYSGNLATSQALIIGNTISGNTAYDGGGICCHDASPRIRRNTMTGNMAGEYGGAIYSVYSAWPKVGNCILWNDGATFAGTEEIAFQYGGGIEVSHSDVEGGWLGEGNIDADPQFVHPGWKDYRLLWGSPCIDSGHPDYLDQDGTRSDMGAFYFDQSKPLVAYLTQQARRVHRGDTKRVLYTLANCHDQPQPCAGIVELILPDGEPWPGNPLEGPAYGVMCPRSNWQYVREYEVPMAFPLGTSSFTWKVGVPGNLFDTDTFEFTVVEP